jgi:uncharacterized membrane-anchored protein
MGKSFVGVPRHLFIYIVVLLTFFAARAQQTSQSQGITWQQGPITAALGNSAEIKVPVGYRFTDAAGAKRVMELTENPTSGHEVGLLAPIRTKDGKNQDWFVLFEFEEVGYVDDKEKDKLDANAILDSLKKGTENANEVRKQRGWPAFHITGWEKPPFYDEQTHNLTWAVLGQSDPPPVDNNKPDGKPAEPGVSVNYSVRLLGRRGTMDVDLVLSPEDLPATVPVFNEIMKGFSYTSGNRYAEFMKGDKVAGYGLTALIAGGAAAAAVKTGLFAKLFKVIAAAGAALWKFVVIALAAIGRFFKQIAAAVKGMFGRKKQEGNQPIEETRPPNPTAPE